MRKVLMVLLLALAGAFPAYAQVWGGGSLSVGIKENKERAGLGNMASEIYVSDDGCKPVTQTPCFIQESNEQRLALPNHIPGSQGKIWLRMKSAILNAGEIKSVELTFRKNNGERITVPADVSKTQADFWVDMSQFEGGSYPMQIQVTHMGGEVTYHVLFFLFRSEKEVTDQTVAFLTVYDPERPYSQAEIQLSRYLRGFEPGNSAKAYKLNTNQDMPIVQAPIKPVTMIPNPSGEFGGQVPVQTGTVTIGVYQSAQDTERKDGLRTKGRFALKNEQGSLVGEQTGDQLTFTVPPGLYRVIGYGNWQIRGFQSTLIVTAGQPVSIKVYRKEGAK